MRCADRLVLMERGRISHQTPTTDLAAVAAIEALLAEVQIGRG